MARFSYAAVLALLLLGAVAQDKTNKTNATRPCKQKGQKKPSLAQIAAARAWAATGKPDPTCKMGILSMAGRAPNPQVCCPSYCGECSDYPTCASVNGQNSKNSCCASAVLEMDCAKGKAPMNKCLKPCTEGMAPCIMEEGVAFVVPAVTSAAEDCMEAVPEWMEKAEAGDRKSVV